MLALVGLSSSTYYAIQKRKKSPPSERAISVNRGGRPIPGYSLAVKGEKVCDEQIKEYLCEAIAGDGFPYGYRKLTDELRETYNLIINKKKVYRLCKELDILCPQRKVKKCYPRRLARRDTVAGPNELWQIDIKYGYIEGTGQFFFQLSAIDVFDRSILSYHLGLRCTAKDACRVLREALQARGLNTGKGGLKVRTDNGSQFTSNAFEELCETLEITHERTPVRTPNMNAYIESFHGILESECYSRHEFNSFQEAYRAITEYMVYYSERRRHGSLGNKSPKDFLKLFEVGTAEAIPFAA